MAKYAKKNNTPVMVLTIILLLVAAVLGGMVWFVSSHIFVDGRAYPKNAKALDLRGKTITAETYDNLRARLPGCEIRWDVPFQGSAYPDDTTALTVHSLSDADLARLERFPKLERLDAAGCRDYDRLMELKAQRPDLVLTYTVDIGGTDYPQDADSVACSDLSAENIARMGYLPQLRRVDATGCADPAAIRALAEANPELEINYQVELLGQTFTEKDTAAAFRNPDVGALMTGLGSLPALETVDLGAVSASGSELKSLAEAYPDIQFHWEKAIFGKTFQSSDAEIDLSGLDVGSLAQVEDAMQAFPYAKKVILANCGFENEELAAFREKMRPSYKVVWTVRVTGRSIRTDQEIIHSSALQVCFIDEQSQDLKYCEDAIVVDIGHSYMKNLEWVKGMPNLKYLILAPNWLRDLSPLSSCKNMVYLELFWNKYIEDSSPLVECTALKDLNISGTYADIEPLYQMTWLDNLWANGCGLSESEQAQLREHLPNTTVSTLVGDYTVGGWRQVPGYYAMRDLMGLPYNKW